MLIRDFHLVGAAVAPPSITVQRKTVVLPSPIRWPGARSVVAAVTGADFISSQNSCTSFSSCAFRHPKKSRWDSLNLPCRCHFASVLLGAYARSQEGAPLFSCHGADDLALPQIRGLGFRLAPRPFRFQVLQPSKCPFSDKIPQGNLPFIVIGLNSTPTHSFQPLVEFGLRSAAHLVSDVENCDVEVDSLIAIVGIKNVETLDVLPI